MVKHIYVWYRASTTTMKAMLFFFLYFCFYFQFYTQVMYRSSFALVRVFYRVYFFFLLFSVYSTLLPFLCLSSTYSSLLRPLLGELFFSFLSLRRDPAWVGLGPGGWWCMASLFWWLWRKKKKKKKKRVPMDRLDAAWMYCVCLVWLLADIQCIIVSLVGFIQQWKTDKCLYWSSSTTIFTEEEGNFEAGELLSINHDWPAVYR